MALFRSPTQSQPKPASGPLFTSAQPISPKEYEFIRQLVYNRSRINLGANKKELVMARLSKRLRALKIPSYGDYIQMLQSPSGADELTHFIDSISTNHTYFFREEEHFRYLTHTVLPRFCDNSRAGRKTFNVWSAAASTGEEACSIAITLAEYFRHRPGWDWRILLTDISTRALGKAREGIFTADRLGPISQQLQRDYFSPSASGGPGALQIKPALRSRMQFVSLNLLSASYPFRETFPAIFCRNVMIYFDKPTQTELVGNLTRHLEPGGTLMIGHAESLTGVQHSLKQIKPAIFEKPR